MKVFSWQCFEQCQHPFLLIGMVIYKLLNGFPVATRQFIILFGQSVACGFIECCFVSMPYTILFHQSGFISLSLLRGHFGQFSAFNGRHNIHRIECTNHALSHCFGIVGQSDSNVFVFSKRRLSKAVSPIFRCPHHHIAHASGKKGSSAVIGKFVYRRVIFGIVINFKLHLSFVHSLSSCVNHHKVDASSGGIIANEVNFGVVASAKHHLFRAAIVAKGLGMHQHSARSRQVKPSQVEHRFGFASP